MSEQAKNSHYDGPATVVRHAIYVHRGIIPSGDLREEFPNGSVLVTSSAERAILEGLPPPEHRPALGSLMGGPPGTGWSADRAIERLRNRLRLGGAVCIRFERVFSHVELILGWRDEVAIGFPRGETEAGVTDLVLEETGVLTGLSLSIPANQSPEFSLFDRATLAWLPHDERPVSIPMVSGGTAAVWAAGREDTIDRERFRRLISAEGGGGADPGLVHSALDHTLSPLLGFLAAWAAVERIINRSFQAQLALVETGVFGAPPPLIVKVLQRRDAENYRPSITDNFLLTCFGLGSTDLEKDERAFKQLNRLRQAIYHRGDLADLGHAREAAVRLLLRLLTLVASGAAATVEA